MHTQNRGMLRDCAGVPNFEYRWRVSNRLLDCSLVNPVMEHGETLSNCRCVCVPNFGINPLGSEQLRMYQILDKVITTPYG